MENNNTKKLDLSILKNKKRISMSSKEALKDVVPINWSEDVLSGKRKSNSWMTIRPSARRLLNMCKPGDIIVIDRYCDADKEFTRHSFIVLSDDAGQIQGLDYDFVCNVMSSFKNEEQRKKKLSYPGNFEVKNIDTTVDNGNDKDGYAKAEQFYYFSKEKTEYTVIGFILKDVFERLLEFIVDLEIPIIEITDNL